MKISSLTKRINRIAIDIGFNAFVLLSYACPKKKKLIVFYPTHNENAYTGNCKYVFEYICKHHPEIQCKWLSSSKSLLGKTPELKKYYAQNFIKRCFYLLRANIIVLDWTLPIIGYGNYRVVQLWHGSGFKSIGIPTVDLKNHNKKPFKFYRYPKKPKDRYISHVNQYVFISASSEADQERKKKSFKTDKVLITGSPRNDVLFDEEIKLDTRRKLNINDQVNQVYLYAPTFRDSGLSKNFSLDFLNRLNESFRKKNSILLIKRHPFEMMNDDYQGLDCIFDVSKTEVDTNAILAITDVLITDYSGISTDFSITGRPIIFYTYDYDSYVNKERQMYYDLAQVLPGPYAYTENDLINLIRTLNSWFKNNEYRVNYTKFQNFFHFYKDKLATERTVKIIFDYLHLMSE